jgi:uncharacterized protein YktA (UPF0223 family)
MGIIKDFFDKKLDEKEMLEFLNAFNLEIIKKSDIKRLDHRYHDNLA